MTLTEQIQLAKDRLPLPDLMARINDSDHAKPSAPSPFRDGDNKSCFGIFKGTNGRWQWKDHVTGEFGDEIDYLAVRFDQSREDARKDYFEMAGVSGEKNGAPRPEAPKGNYTNGKKPETGFDWQSCVSALTDSDVERVAEWRGISESTVKQLRDLRLVGKHAGNIAFPVEINGHVVGCHHTPIGEKKWMYSQGCTSTPLIIGAITPETTAIVMESQWDAIALASGLGWQATDKTAFIVTRGASNGALVKDYIQRCKKVVAVPQNDPPNLKTGKIPSEEWFKAVESAMGDIQLYRGTIPAAYKDLNEFAADGADDSAFHEIIASAKCSDDSNVEIFSFKDLLSYPYKDDPNTVLGNRWLTKGSQCLWLGPSGIGKSTLCFQSAMYWALGLPFFGIKPVKPLRSLVFQAEDDMGDCAEFFSGMLQGLINVEKLQMTQDEMNRLLRKNFIIIRDTVHRGKSFAQFARKKIIQTGADMVWINPLFSYAGCSVSDQAAMSEFLRDDLTPIGIETGAIWHVVHHVPKPSTDSKARQHWSDSDFAYMGFGSSEITNWARAINYIEPTKDGPFKLRLAKRGSRAGARPDQHSDERGNTIYMEHHQEYVFWLQVEPPKEAQEEKRKKESRKVEQLTGIIWPASYSEIVQNVKMRWNNSQIAAEKMVTRWINPPKKNTTPLLEKTGEDKYRPAK